MNSLFQGLKYVYAVYREGSFSKAAEKLYISQPSLSANVRRVEEAVGYPLFDRSTKPLHMTEQGLAYIRAAEKILEAEREFSDCVNDLGGLKTGTLLIGGSSLFSSWVLPPLITAFSRQYPGVHLELMEESSRELIHALADGRIDLMLDNTALDPMIFEGFLLREETLLLAVPASFPINEALTPFQIPLPSIMDGTFRQDGRPAAALSSFAGQPFILMRPDNDTGARAAAICQEAGFEPDILLTLDQQMTTYNLTLSGLGISFISDTLIRNVPFHENIVYYALSGERVRRKLWLYRKRERYVTRAMEEFLRIAAQYTVF